MKKIKLQDKPLKMTHQTYLIIEKFGKDIGKLIMDFFFQCDGCADLSLGPIKECRHCSPNMQLCLWCYDITSFRCTNLPKHKCSVCLQFHCNRHFLNDFWTADW